jgi:lipopolysaccharide export system protein LptA
MQYKQLVIGLTMGLMLWGGMALSQIEAAAPENLLNIDTKTKQPITITSDSAVLDNKQHIAIHTGNVVVKWGEVTLYSDEITTWFDEKAKHIIKIEARGAVKMVHLNRTLTSEAGTYFDREQKLVLTGNPVCTEDENILTGSRITYFMREDKIVVENAKSVLHPPADTEEKTNKPEL